MAKHVAVVGSGISGLLSAYLLSQRYEVTLFEANDYLGGHTHTIQVPFQDHSYAIDTGFIVFNKKTYPNFCKLLEKINVPFQLSEMSFSYRSDANNIEYNGHSINTLFSDRRNLFRPKFYQFIKEILRFNKEAKKFLVQNNGDMTIGGFLQYYRYSQQFVEYYLLPMMASIWSKKREETLNCSASFIFKFYDNHGLLEVRNRPEWYVIKNGSASYIDALTRPFKERIFLNTKITNVTRRNNQVILSSSKNQYIFDEIVIATHSDQALNLLTDASKDEQDILSAITYTDNNVILHTDSSIMPKQKRAWASWNYLDNGSTEPTLTYYMNRLQSIKAPCDFFVSVNLHEKIAERKILGRFYYSHPCLNETATKAQLRLAEINGKNNTYFAGAYWGAGFHEDGINSAIKACELLGVTL